VAAKRKSVRGDLEIELTSLNGRNIDNLILSSVVMFDVDLKLEWWNLIQ